MGGHKGIIQHLSSLTSDGNNELTTTLSSSTSAQKSFDEIRVLPVYRHMFAEKRGNQVVSYDDRLEMCRLAFGHLPNVVVSDDERNCFDWVAEKQGITSAEEKQALRVGTADLLDMILENDPSIELTLALGADTFMDLTTWKWRRAKDIIRILKGRFIVFQRKVQDDDDANSSSGTVVTEEELQKRIDDIKEDCPDLKRNIIIENVSYLTPVSSSSARTSLDENYLKSEICVGVLEYMKQKKLYQFAS